jgi:predicted transcriptional regulator
MSIFRVSKNKENPYVMVSKAWINDKNISAKAKGILLYLLSKPDDWKIYESDIVNNMADGKASIKSGIQELIKAGYIKREENRNKKGQFAGYIYYVYESPHRVRFSDIGFPDIGKPATTNNNITNNNITNNIYLTLKKCQGRHNFLDIYFKEHKNILGREHVKISNEQLDIILKKLDILKASVDAEDFSEAVQDYLVHLPENNNGNILAFIEAHKRYFNFAV